MAFGVHPYVSGAAHRIRYFDQMLDYFASHDGVAFWNGDQICDWFTAQRPRSAWEPSTPRDPR